MSGHIKDMVSQHWNTPEYIVQAVRETFWGSIDLDPCDNEFSITQARVSWKYPRHDGLKESWSDVATLLDRRISVFCNPPFGRSADGTSVADWAEKASKEQQGTDIYSLILLLPSSTETTFWHKYIWPTANAVAFLKGRVAFTLDGKKSGASTKGTALVYWGEDTERFFDVFDKKFGKVVLL